MEIRLKTKKDIENLQESGKILSYVLKELVAEVKEGVNLQDLDKKAANLIRESKAKAAFYNYFPEGANEPFPGHICASLNDQIVHGVPGNYNLKKGDVLTIDCGIDLKGYITDAAVTVVVDEPSEQIKKLLKTAKKALSEGIKACHSKNTLGDIGWAIQRTVTTAGFSVIRNLTGHGVGFDVHEPPAVFNIGKPGTGMRIKEGLVLAIEPMISPSSEDIILREDGSFSTADGSLSVHFETTVAVVEGRPMVLVQLPL